MTIGTGIFSSVILLLIAAGVWQTTRQGKWRLVGKVSAIILGLIFSAGVAIYVWQYISNRPPAPAVVTELAGVRIGSAPSDVTIAFGKPETTTEPTEHGKQIAYDYIYSSPSLEITFIGPDRWHPRVEIVCTGDFGEKLLGYDISDTENAISQRLGKPSGFSISKDGLSKIITFREWKAAFVITKGKVSQKCITSSGTMKFNEQLLTPEEQKAADRKALDAMMAQYAAQAAAQIKAIAAADRPHPAALVPLKPVPAANSLPDPCAPDLAKAERLRRLALSGSIRQNGWQSYVAGEHTVSFTDLAGDLAYCR